MSKVLLFLGTIGTSIVMFIIFTIGIIRIEMNKSKEQENQSVTTKIIVKMFIGMGICLFIQFYYSIVLNNLKYFIYTVIGIICCFAAIITSYCKKYTQSKENCG